MARHPHDIVPLDGNEELLVAIYDVLVDIRNALVPPPQKAEAPALADGVVTQAEASEAASVLATHEHQTAKKPAAKKPARKKPATRKKSA